MKIDLTEFPKWLREERTKKGYSTQRFAIMTGVDRTAIEHWEREKTFPTLFYIECCVNALGYEFYIDGQKMSISDIGTYFVEVCKEYHISTRELSKQLGFSNYQVYSVRINRTGKAKNIQKIADALDIKIEVRGK